MLMNNVLIVVVNVHNLYVISFDILIQYRIYLENILEQIIDIQKKGVDHVLREFLIHVEYYLDNVQVDEELLHDIQFLEKKMIRKIL
jgi:hypothetical protein